MRILLVTPLFPPDTATAGRYTKELAARLAARGHTVTVLLYGHLPETIPHVTLVAADKRTSLLRRSLTFTWRLFTAARTADTLLIMNGHSVELPALLVSYLRPRTQLLVINDAHGFALGHARPLYRFIFKTLCGRVRALVTLTPGLPPDATPLSEPPSRPEIHSLHPYPAAAFAAYEVAWDDHLAALLTRI